MHETAAYDPEGVHEPTKAERGAARERVSRYHETELARLVERVEQTIARYRLGEIDVHDVDEVIRRYSKAARELWKFCWSGTRAPISCSSLGRSADARSLQVR